MHFETYFCRRITLGEPDAIILPAPWGRCFQVGDVVGTKKLEPIERVWVDRSRLSRATARRADMAWPQTLSGETEGLATALANVEQAARKLDFCATAPHARVVEATALRLGMTSMANAAQAVAICAQAGDDIALAATTARLMRVSEATFRLIWKMSDMSV